MREIKCRAWFPKTKRMTESFTLGQPIEQIENTRREENGFYLQYTGLKDKKGKEIYEGDIIKLTAKWKTYSKEDDLYEDNYKSYIGVVKIYSQGIIIKVYKQEGDDCYITDEDGKQILNMPKIKRIAGYRSEKTGNIYKNPKLLKDK